MKRKNYKHKDNLGDKKLKHTDPRVAPQKVAPIVKELDQLEPLPPNLIDDPAQDAWGQNVLKEDNCIVAAIYDGGTELHLAAASGDVSQVISLCQAGYDINAVDSQGKTALDWAEEKYNTEESQKLANTIVILRSYRATIALSLEAGDKTEILQSDASSSWEGKTPNTPSPTQYSSCIDILGNFKHIDADQEL